MSYVTGVSDRRSWIDRFFYITARGSNVRTELVAGLATFLVMAYIIVVNPAILSFSGIPDLQGKGLPFPSTLTMTCVTAGILCLAMGLYAKNPLAMAPGMGLNAFVAFQLIAGSGLTPGEAMSVILAEGVVITILVFAGLRHYVMKAFPAFMRYSIAIGIGLFILTIGLVNGGVAIPGPSGTLGAPATLSEPTFVVTAFGLVLVGALAAMGYRASIVVGIVVTTLVAIVVNAWTGGAAYSAFPGTAVVPSGVFGSPDFSNFGLGLTGTAIGKLGLVTFIVLTGSVMLSDFFDTYGTIQGVGRQAGLVDENGEYPDGQTDKILRVDSVGPILGGLFGSSSNTTYIESSAGVSVGGKTGLTAVVVGALFLLAMFFTPLFQVVPPQATAPALILVGVYMLRSNIIPLWNELKDWGEHRSLVGWIPAALTMFVMPATYNITHGIGFGVVSYVLLMTCTGQFRKVSWVMWAVAVAFVLYFVFGKYA